MIAPKILPILGIASILLLGSVQGATLQNIPVSKVVGKHEGLCSAERARRMGYYLVALDRPLPFWQFRWPAPLTLGDIAKRLIDVPRNTWIGPTGVRVTGEADHEIFVYLKRPWHFPAYQYPPNASHSASEIIARLESDGESWTHLFFGYRVRGSNQLLFAEYHNLKGDPLHLRNGECEN